jgi:sugar fermentation stimulation protein A
MKYQKRPIRAVFKKRPNKFLGVVEIKGKKTLCFIPNPGRMKELLIPGTIIYLLKKTGRYRKTDYDLILVKRNGDLISIDSRYPNKLFAEAIKDKKLEEFKEYVLGKKEPIFHDSRLDFLLTKKGKHLFIECKSCTLVENGTALFPDAPTKRGVKHMNTLVKALDQALSAVVFIVQRDDAKTFSPNSKMDTEFTKALRNANKMGVETFAYNCKIDLNNICIDKRIPVYL